jgi:lysozyme
MNISDEGLALIKQFEGFSATPYLCPAGYFTIGYGHVITPAERSSLLRVTEVEAGLLLKKDVRIAASALRRMVSVPLAQNQFDTLVSFVFNLGSGAFQRSTLRRVINCEEHEAVPEQLLRWVWAGGRKLPGLLRRRIAEGYMYQGLNWRHSQ